MQQSITHFIIDAEEIDNIFNSFTHKSPFNLKKSIKVIMKEYNYSDYNDFYAHLFLEIQTAYKDVKPKNYIYHNGKYYKIAILKYRMQDISSNSGKSKGWRIVALVDEENNLFFLLDLYKHSNGKDDLTPDENKKVRLLCDEYADSI